MDKDNFTCSITVSVTPAEAWEAITRVSGWWAKHVEGDTCNVGGIFKTRFGETFGVFKITESVPGSKIVWEVLDCYLPIFKNVRDWEGTTLLWEVLPLENATQIVFTHIGLVPGKECYNDCFGGWTFYITASLHKLITQGVGLPGIGIRCTIAGGSRIYKGTLFFKSDALPDVAGEYILIDVRTLDGEHVIAANSVIRLNKAAFSTEDLRGNYYMIVEDTPAFENINPYEDLLAIFKMLNRQETVNKH